MPIEYMQVSGMTCGHCTDNVTRALKSVHGVSEVSVSLWAGEAKVQYDDSQTSPEQLKAAVKSAGYGVDVFTAVSNG